MLAALPVSKSLRFSAWLLACRTVREVCFTKVIPPSFCKSAVVAARLGQKSFGSSHAGNPRVRRKSGNRRFGRKKGRIFGGQDKRTWHYAAHVLEIIVVCTLFRWCASGTPFLTPLVPRFRAKPWLCWFSTGTMAAERAIFGSFGRDATMSGSGKIASSRS